MKRCFQLIIFALFIFASPNAEAGKIKRGFDALRMYDYFKAKTMFTKGMKYSPSAGAYGLAIIYSRNDNPFYSPDSAYVYILKARHFWAQEKEGKKLKWGGFGWTDQGIDSLRNEISSMFYANAKDKNTVGSYNEFITKHPWAKEVTEATEKRDSIAFYLAVQQNTSSAFQEYLSTYPASAFNDLARENLYDAQFEEITGDGSLTSYVEFIKKNPTNPLVVQAEEKIFTIVTEPNSVDAYEVFIQKYPSNSFVPKAWEMLYQTYLASDFSKEGWNHSLKSIPNVLFSERVNQDFQLEDHLFLPVQLASGAPIFFIDQNGQQMLEQQFDQIGPMKEGLAVFLSSETNQYGAINKRGEVQVAAEFDEMSEFKNGLSLVAKNEKYGVLHRNGRMVLDCQFDDLGMYADGLIYAVKDEKYGYYDINGRTRIEAKFEDAYDFQDGKAKVVFEGNEAIVDIYGTYVVPPVAERVDFFNDSLYIFEEDGFVGLMNRLGKAVVPATYDYIGLPNEGLALAQLDGEVLYLNGRGEVVIQGEYEAFPNVAVRGEFKDGAAIVYKEEGYGRISIAGKVITEPKYENLLVGKDAILFQEKGLWGIMNHANKVLVKPVYNVMDVLEGNKFLAQSEGDYGVVDQSGAQIVPFVFREITTLPNDLFLVTNAVGKMGIFGNGELIVPTDYNSISVFDQDFLLLNNGGLSYFSLKEKKVIQPAGGPKTE